MSDKSQHTFNPPKKYSGRDSGKSNTIPPVRTDFMRKQEPERSQPLTSQQRRRETNREKDATRKARARHQSTNVSDLLTVDVGNTGTSQKSQVSADSGTYSTPMSQKGKPVKWYTRISEELEQYAQAGALTQEQMSDIRKLANALTYRTGFVRLGNSPAEREQRYRQFLAKAKEDGIKPDALMLPADLEVFSRALRKSTTTKVWTELEIRTLAAFDMTCLRIVAEAIEPTTITVDGRTFQQPDELRDYLTNSRVNRIVAMAEDEFSKQFRDITLKYEMIIDQFKQEASKLHADMGAKLGNPSTLGDNFEAWYSRLAGQRQSSSIPDLGPTPSSVGEQVDSLFRLFPAATEPSITDN